MSKVTDKVIIAFLRKEAASLQEAKTDGVKLFYKGTCMGQWINHRVLTNNTEYTGKGLDNFVIRLQWWMNRSDLINQKCTKAVPVGVEDLRHYV